MVRRVTGKKAYAIIGPPGPGDSEYNPNNAFPLPATRFFLEKDEVLDWELPPGGTYTVADVHFKVYDFGVDAVGDWLAIRASHDLWEAAAERRTFLLGYRLWKDYDGIISHDYLLQVAVAGESPVPLAVLLPIVIRGLIFIALFIVSKPHVEYVRDILVGTPEAPPIPLQEGDPAPPGAVDVEGNPIPVGTPLPRGAYIPRKKGKKGIFDTLGGPGIVLISAGVLGVVALSMTKR